MSKKKNKTQIVEGEEVISPKKKINGRSKGHGGERDLVLILKSWGFEHAKTSRFSSRMLDDSKVDISGVPLNIQMKVGYWNNRPKPEVIFKEMSAHLESNFSPGNPQRDYPKVLFHVLDRRQDEHQLITMMFKDWSKIYRNSLKWEKHLKDLQENNKPVVEKVIGIL